MYMCVWGLFQAVCPCGRVAAVNISEKNEDNVLFLSSGMCSILLEYDLPDF